MQLRSSYEQSQGYTQAEYSLNIPPALEQYVNRQYKTFVQDCEKELKDVYELAPGQYVGQVAKNAETGLGKMLFVSGDAYSGMFKNGFRHGAGVCKLSNGALYRGEWRHGVPHGPGILHTGRSEFVECSFEHGRIPNSRIKIMFQDGTYYEGNYANHRRHGQGTCYYPNGDIYEGNWTNDKRAGRGKMKFAGGGTYMGQFIDDQADGDGQYEDRSNSLF